MEERIDSVVARLETEGCGFEARASLASLQCVLEQDTFILA